MKKIILKLAFISIFALSGCGKKPIPENHEHSFSNWQVDDSDYHKKTCECGEVILEPHNFEAQPVEDNSLPTHLKSGEITYICKDCGYSYVDILPELLEHSFVIEKVDNSTLKSEATCYEPAYYYYSCECGDIDPVNAFASGEPLGHTFSSELSFESGYKNRYKGGEEFDLDSIEIYGYCQTEKKNIKLSSDELEITYSDSVNNKLSCGDEKVTISYKDKSVDVPVFVDHNLHNATDESGEILICEQCNEKFSPKIIDLSQSNPSINFDELKNAEIKKIYVDVEGQTFELGNDLSNLSIPSTLKEDISYHGSATITVEAVLNDEDLDFTYPVILATKVITNQVDLLDAVQTNSTSAPKKDGYFVLGNDISGELFNSSISWATANTGFIGTLDGNGHTLTSTVIGRGLFGQITNNGVVKNTKFVATNFTNSWNRQILACGANGCTIENCSFLFSCVGSGTVNGQSGAVISKVGGNPITIKNCTFNNNGSTKVDRLISGITNAYTVGSYVKVSGNIVNNLYPNMITYFATVATDDTINANYYLVDNDFVLA